MLCIKFHFRFYHLEEEGHLDPSNETDLFCLHYVFMPRINWTLEEFRMGWNFHSIRTESNLPPYQMWISGVITNRLSTFTGVRDVLNSEVSLEVNFMVLIHVALDAFLKTTMLK